MAEVPGALKIFFPLLYYGLCTTMFAFLVIENDHWDNFNTTFSAVDNKHSHHYANAEYVIVQIGFVLVMIDFVVTMIISMFKGRFMSSDIYKIDDKSSDPADVAAIIFRKLGVFGAYWAIFQFVAGIHLQAWLMEKSNADDDIYLDFMPFFIPPIIGLLTVVLPTVTPGDYQLVSTTGSYM